MNSETIKQRLRATLFATPLPEQTMRQATRFATELRPAGTWADLEVVDPFTVGILGSPEHLQRTLLLAQTMPDEHEANDQISLALDSWLAHDFRADDWRQNQLTVPRLIGSVALRLGEELSAGARGKVMEILSRSRWHHWLPTVGWREWTGTTLLRVAHNMLLRGCVENTPAMFEETFRRVFGAIRFAADGEEGIQADMIYRSPGASSDHDSGGLAFVNHCARFIALAHGTPWQAPVEAVKLLAAFLLDGQQWLMRNGSWDPNFPQQTPAPRQEDLLELAATVDRLAQLGDTPSRSELAALARRLAGQGGALTGHRHFWRSGFSVHQRPAFYASVCLPLDAARPAEGQSARNGTICLMQSGGEYSGLHLVGNEGLPGPTFFRHSPAPAGDVGIEESSFATGGVSEGEYGLAAMQTAKPGYGASKAWFFFDQSFICLGAGITAKGSNQPAVTSVCHCRLNGPVSAAADRAQPRALAPGTEHALPMIRRVSHDGITYHFIKLARVAVPVGVPPERFALYLNHGLNPTDESYAYAVLPFGDDPNTKPKIDEETAQIEVLSNTPALQAVRHRGLRMVQAVFWRAGVLTMPDGGRVAANQPCLLLCRDAPSTGKRITIANLRDVPATVHVEYAGKCVAFELPGGPDARRGISRSL